MSLYSQDDKGTIIDYIPQANNDTIKVTRWYGDWWYGVGVSTQFNQYFGNFYAPSIVAVAPSPQFNPEFEFTNGSGYGYSIGTVIEYNPISSNHGGFLRINYLNRTFNTKTETISVSDSRNYQIESKMQFIELRPAYRYDFGFLNLYAYAGPGFDIYIGQKSRHFLKFENTGTIKQDNKFNIDDPKTRISLNLGVGLDLFVTDLNGLRFRFSPFVSADFGTNLLGKQSDGLKDAAINLASVRIGVSLKLGPDHKTFETIKFDSNYRGPNYEIASLKKNVNLSSDLRDTLINPLDIAYYDLPEPIEIVREEPAIFRKSNTEEQKSNIKLETNRMNFFEFPTSDATQLTDELKNYLNSVAQYMLENPKSEIRIVGHSDNMGSPEENQRRSVVRKDRVVRYLLAKGINRYRILDRGEGDRRPIADIKTAEGRKKNRRVEITIIQ